MANLLTKTEVLQVVQNAKNKSFTYIIVSLLIIIVLLLGAIQPTIMSINKVLFEISEKEFIISNADVKINAISTLKREYNESVGKNFKDIALVYPARGDLSLFLVNIDELARNNGFELKNISFEGVQNEEGASEIEVLQVLEPYYVTIQINGDPNNFISFLNKIEEMPSNSIIEKVSVGQGDSKGYKDYTVNIKIYRVRESEFYSL